jgi:hypothetical protein
MGLRHLAHLAQSKLREHAKRGSAIARVLTGEPARSPHWRTIEKRWLHGFPGGPPAHDVCACCGCRLHLQVHHIKPFHLWPSLELQDGTGVAPATGGAGATPNFITLCMGPFECHLEIGHAGSFRSEGNPRVVEDAALVRNNPALRADVVAKARLARLAAA